MTMSEWYIGCDLGQSQDPTAIVLLEHLREWTGERDPQSWNQVVRETYNVRHLERTLGSTYPAIVERVREIADKLTRNNGQRPQLVVDGTGVGRPVVDMIQRAGIQAQMTAVTIHGGEAESFVDGYYRVPKRNLCGRLAVMLQQKELRIAEALPLAEVLIRELLSFKVTISKTGHDSYGNDWREQEHDDCVLALALACWHAKRVKSGFRSEVIA